MRLYNWTSDANNNIPISANRFDGEDSDFASGLSLCLTRDGQGAPTVPLTWSQPLTINVSTDETVIAAGRTGGVNNPQLQLKVADATGATINLSTAQQLALAIAGTVYLAISGTGALSVKAPSGNAAIGIATSAYTFGNSTDNPSYTFAGSGTLTLPSGGIAAGVLSTGIVSVGGLNLTGSALPSNGLYLPGANTLGFAANGVAAGSINSAGAWSIAAASSGRSLTVNGGNGNYTAAFAGNSAANNSYGVYINAGTSATDVSFRVDNQAASATPFEIWGDGEIIITQPSAATNQGGSLWQVGYLDTPLNAQTAANYTLVLTDRGKFIRTGAGFTYTIPANSSVAFPVGTTIVIMNAGGTANSIAITTDTLTWLPSGGTGTRTLAANSVATLYKYQATGWYIWGFGLT